MIARTDLPALLQEGMRRHQSGDLPRAEHIYRQVLAADAGAADGWHMLALALAQQGRPDEAMAAAARATGLRPQIAPYWLTLAKLEIERGRLAEAIAAYQEAFSLDPDGRFDRAECFALFARLKFDELPDFWHGELIRFLGRQDIDQSRYAIAGVNVLMARPAFRAALAAGQGQRATAALEEIMRDELFAILLRDTLIGRSEVEFMLTWLRCSLLQDAALLAQAPLEFLCNLALQCFNSEFVYAETGTETGAVGDLAQSVEQRLRGAPGVDEPLLRAVALLATYRPLRAVSGIDALLAHGASVEPLGRLLRRTASDAREETRLRGTIRVLGGVSDGVSRQVQAMYEENPYPRWLSLDRSAPVSATQWIAAQLVGDHPDEKIAEAPNILVAGCGTGRDAIALAAEIEGARVTAVDLSLSSLAFAKRKAEEMGVANIEFCRADILQLDALGERFDIVYCVGVLHHMRDPEEGLSVLCRLGRPGGLLKLGLYSARSRVELNAARELVREQRLTGTESSIRAFRQHVLAQDADSPLRGLLRYRDFFSMSECRDLLFHVQDYEFSLLQIAQMLRGHGLTVLAVSNPSRPAVLAYQEMFSQDRGMADLDKWDAVEQSHPQAFAGMYQIWCRFPGNVANDGAG